MFLAIINDTYGAVKSEVLQGRSHIGSYIFLLFKKTYSWCLRKRNIKGHTKKIPSVVSIKGQSSVRIQKRVSEILRE